MTEEGQSEAGPAKRGRPRKFDRDEVLGRLMVLFWAQGYEDTSHADIRAASGLSGSSLDRAFGTKLELFITVLEHYHQATAPIVAPLADPSAGLAVIDGWLDIVDDALASEPSPSGCLVVSTITQPIAEDARVAQRAQDYLGRLSDALRSVLEHAVALGEVPEDAVERRLALLMGGYIGFLTAAGSPLGTSAARAMVAGLKETIGLWMGVDDGA
ncbi:MAG: TetR/AcrR family transcriptional regulator [Actinomycetota bacterium]